MNRLPRIKIDAPFGYKQEDFLDIVKKRIPKPILSVDKGVIAMHIYNLGEFKKNDKMFSAWGMRTNIDMHIIIQEIE